MRVIKSIVTTDTILTSSNIPENEFPMWVANTNYNIGDSVIYQHNIYTVIIAHNNRTITPDLDTTYWLFVSATNRFRMFDNVVNSLSTRTGTIQFTLQPNQVVDSICLFELNAATVRVRMNDPVSGIVYDETKALADYSTIVDIYAYFFEPIGEVLKSALFLDLPAYPTASITVTIDAGGGEATVGEVIYGSQRVIGRTKYGTSFGLKSFSRKETDEFGRVTVVKRKNSKFAEYDIDIDNSVISNVQRFFDDIESVPCVFIGVTDGTVTYEPLIVYGFYNDFKAVVSFPTVSTCNLRVEGLI